MSHITSQAGSARLPELDGMRAVAVVSVILFHCEITGVLDAGFFGVDIFFTISGFIITAILLREFRATGTIGFSNFYFRRLKRLLPPVAALLAVAYPVTAALAPDALAWFRADLPAAVGYLSNVWQIHAGQSYFDTTPHVLKHLWSLAVEEQFYLLWPLPAWLLMRSAGARATGVVALLLALASTAWMWFLFEQNSDAADQNRIYLGTDTHAMGLLVGAALACWWNPWQRADLSARQRTGWNVAAVLAAGLLCYMLQRLNPSDPAMYRGCFLLVPLLTCVILYASINNPRSWTAWLLRTAVFQWLGKRSYSLYLMHWPVFVWMRLSNAADFSDPVTLVTGLGLVLVLSAMLYFCVEAPTTAYRPRFGWAPMASASAACTLAAWTWCAVTTVAWDDNKAAMASAAKARAVTADAIAAAAELAATAPVAGALPIMPTDALAEVPDAAIDAGEKISGGEDIYAIGDSVLLGSSAYLAKTIPGIRIDAAVGRQASNGLKVVQEWIAGPHKASTVIVHLGTNGYINEGQFKALLQTLTELPHVIVINVHADRRWTTPNNEIIARTAREFPNVAVIDWSTLSANRPDYFVKDGIHLTRRGILAMTAQIKLATGGSLITPDSAPDLAPAARSKIMLADSRPARPARHQRNVPAEAPPPAATATTPAPALQLAAGKVSADVAPEIAPAVTPERPAPVPAATATPASHLTVGASVAQPEQ